MEAALRSIGRWATRMIVVITLGLGMISFGSPRAFANPSSIPPVDISYYVPSSVTPAITNGWGCSQGHADASSGHTSVVILDFGRQNASGSGTYPIGSQSVFPLGTEEYLTAQFALGYSDCSNHQADYLTLAMGTSNYSNASGSNLSYSNGQIWGQAVQAVANNASSAHYNVSIAGAGDWEAWGSFSDLTNWEQGYYSTTGALLYDYGSADGCPYNYLDETGVDYGCDSGGWNQSANYLAAWGWAPAMSVPEIYNNGCYLTVGGVTNYYPAQEIQWANIPLSGAVNDGSQQFPQAIGPIIFMAPLYSPGGCEASPQNSYIDLWNALNNRSQTAMTPPFLSRI